MRKTRRAPKKRSVKGGKADPSRKLEEIAKALGSVTILGGDREFRVKAPEGISSGSLTFNRILTGSLDVGYSWGRVYELYGPEGSGKTTLAIHAIAEAQKAGYFCGYVDVEHALDPGYAANIGARRFLLSQPDSGEHALATIGNMVTKGVRVVVMDSVAALVPQAELEGDIGDSHVGLHARLMSQALRKLTPVVAKSKAIVLFLNQLRMKIGVKFGNPETTSGGMALRYYASVRVDIRAPRSGKMTWSKKESKSLEDDGIQETDEGTHVMLTTKKNKMFPPFKKARLSILYGKGIDRTRDVLTLALGAGIVSDVTDKTFVYRKKVRNISQLNEAQVVHLEAAAREKLGVASNVG